MVDQYIFNSQGDWVAFRVGNNIFLAESSEWFGTVEGDYEVYSPSGEYIGFLSDDDRILCDVPKPLKPLMGLAPLPLLPPLPPLPPLHGLYLLLPFNLMDVFSND